MNFIHKLFTPRNGKLLMRAVAVYLFLWFGINQIMDPGSWLGFLPEWLGYIPVPGEMIVQLNGFTEIMLALMLLSGLFTRVVAFLLGVHLFFIGLSVSGPTAVRDISLGLFVLSFAFQEVDEWTLDHYFATK